MAGMAVSCEANCAMYEKTFNFRSKHRKYGKGGLKNVFFSNFGFKPEKNGFLSVFSVDLKRPAFYQHYMRCISLAS